MLLKSLKVMREDSKWSRIEMAGSYHNGTEITTQLGLSDFLGHKSNGEIHFLSGVLGRNFGSIWASIVGPTRVLFFGCLILVLIIVFGGLQPLSSFVIFVAPEFRWASAILALILARFLCFLVLLDQVSYLAIVFFT